MTAASWAWSIFFLGLTTGAVGLLFSEYLVVSPRWFRWVLVVGGAGVVLRYWLIALTAITPRPLSGWFIRSVDVWTSIGLTLPCAAALDQLVRHPAMTPKKLLRWYAPVAVAWVPAILVANLLAAIVQTAFALCMVWLGAQVMRKVPVRHLRLSVAALAAAQVLLAAERLVGSRLTLDIRILLVSEGAVLASIWAALRTARTSST